jgi:hypothetical protein
VSMPVELPLDVAGQEPVQLGCAGQGTDEAPNAESLRPLPCSDPSGCEVHPGDNPVLTGGGAGRPIYYNPVSQTVWANLPIWRVQLNATQYTINAAGLYTFASSPSSVNQVQFKTTSASSWTTLWSAN